MADIKLQPTDRCVLDYGTTTTTTTTTERITITMQNDSGTSGGSFGFVYKGSVTQRFTNGKIVSVQLASTSIAGTEFTVTKISDIAYRVEAQRLSTTYEGASISEAVMIKVTYQKEVADKREVFMIYDDEGKMLWCKHKPVYVVFDESQIAAVTFDTTDISGGGGGVDFTESGEDELIPAGEVWTVVTVHCRDGYELDTIELNGVVGTTIDLTDIASLTLDDFKEVEIAVRAKATAQIDPAMREIDPTCIDEQAGEGYLDTRSITTEIREYIDWDGEYSVVEGPRGGDVFMAYGYLENNEDKVVPVIYKTDSEDPDLQYEPDYQDQYFYVGQAVLDGVTYDKWRKIDNETLTWDGDAKKYLYTNVITVDKTVTVLAPEILSTTSLYREENSDWRIEVEVGNPNEQEAQVFIFYQSASTSEWHRAISTTIPGLSQKTYSFTTASVSAGADTPVKAQLQIGDITSEETFDEVYIVSQ